MIFASIFKLANGLAIAMAVFLASCVPSANAPTRKGNGTGAGNPTGRGSTIGQHSGKPAPVAGKIFKAAEALPTGFEVHWTPSTDEYGDDASLEYLVCSGLSYEDVATIEGCLSATIELPFSSNITTYTISNKAPNTTYYYNVIVRDAANNMTIYEPQSVTTEPDTTSPVVGTIIKPNTALATGFNLSWQAASDDATPPNDLEYFVCSGSSLEEIATVDDCLTATNEMDFTVNTLSLWIEGKAPTTTYHYNVVVRDSSGNLSIYPGISVVTDPDTKAPTSGVFKETTEHSATGFTLNWLKATDDIAQASELEYYVCSGSSPAAIASILGCLSATEEMAFSANTLTLTVDERTPETIYYFNVVVRDPSGNQAIYPGISAETEADLEAPVPGELAPPKHVMSTGFTLHWEAAVDNVSKGPDLEYFVCSADELSFILTVDDCLDATEVLPFTAGVSQHSITGKSPLSTYYYNVVVRDDAGNQAIYEGVSATTVQEHWKPMSMVGAPAARTSHASVWTGTEVIIWGSVSGGALYNPETDTWRPMTTVNEPPVISFSHLSNAVWTGTHMFFYASTETTEEYAGALYDPIEDEWIMISPEDAPTPRYSHTTTIVGSKIIVWGGTISGASLNDGAIYDLESDSWTPIDPSPVSGRHNHSAVWTGSDLIIWGGDDYSGNRLNTGAIYNLESNTWTGSTTTSNAPEPRMQHVGLWTGSKMIIWSGRGKGSHTRYDNGKLYDPVSNSWSNMANAPISKRQVGPGVWTGTTMIVWGGHYDGGGIADGGIYHPATNSWKVMTTSGRPLKRRHMPAVWTGSQYVVWGGDEHKNSSTIYNTGAVYTP